MEVCDIGHSRQMLVLRAADYGSVTAILTWWELELDAAAPGETEQEQAEAPTAEAAKEAVRVWRPIGAAPAAIGRGGLSPLKREGDGRTPAGRFPMGTGFGFAPAPAGSWPYRFADGRDYWVDDPDSPEYNQWVRYAGDPAARWRSFERLDIPPYRKAAVIRYNDSPIVRGRGSAIFFHVWSGPSAGSAGCVTVAEETVVRVLEWMAPDAAPVMAIGTERELLRLAPFALSGQ